MFRMYIYYTGELMFISSFGHLIIDDYGVFLRKKRGRLLVVSRDGKYEFAFRNLREVIVTSGVSISSDLLRALAWNGIDLVITSHTGTPLARLIPARMGGTTRNRIEQYRALDDGRACRIMRDLIIGKGRNQVSNLKYYSKARSGDESLKLYEKASMIKDLVSKLKTYEGGDLDKCREDVLSYESQMANIYWSGIGIVCGRYGFRERIKRPEIRRGVKPDIVNIALNIGYNLLAGSLWKYVLRFSLDPFLGFLHVERPGRLSLVYDLIEPLRPILDRFIISLLKRNVLRKDMNGRSVFLELVKKYYEEFLNNKLKYRSRNYRLETIMFLYIEDFVSFLTGRKSSVATPYIPW